MFGLKLMEVSIISGIRMGEMADDRLKLGISVEEGKIVDLTPDERLQGTYIIGTTGTGKSTLIRNMIFQDMHPDKHQGLCLLDPHGDLIDDIIGLVPNERAKDVILFNPMDTDFPIGLNLLACDRKNATEVRWVVSTVISILHRLYEYSWGPRLQYVLTSGLETIMQFEGSTFLELYFLISNKEYREKKVSQLTDPVLREFWDSFPSENARLEYELTASTLNKIAPFITDTMMRNIICQTEMKLKLEDVMNENKILLVNLSKGDLGEVNSGLLGAVLVNMVLMAALKRRKVEPKKRVPFHLYVDEFQNFATESFAILQSEARKYAVDLIVAHQYRDQLDDLNKGSTLNVGNLIVFRTTGPDSYDLASQFDNTPPPPEKVMEPEYRPYKTAEDGGKLFVKPQSTTGVGSFYREVERIRRTYSDMQGEQANKLSVLPNYKAWCRLIYDPESRNIEGEDPSLKQYLIKTMKLDNDRSDIKRKEMANRIKKSSRKLAKPREIVERDIEDRAGGIPLGDDSETQETKKKPKSK
jgi:hypothetical protein